MPFWKRRAPAEAKASAAGPVIALRETGRAVWSPRDYGGFAREGFAKNAIVYRSVRMIAEAAASVPYQLIEGGRRQSEHPLLKLLAAPNPVACGPDLMEDWYGYLLISGNAYLEAVSLDGAPRELYVLRPDRMKVVPGADGWPEAYEYAANGKTARFEQMNGGVRPILHIALFNPANDYYGMSPIEAAAVAIDVHNAASHWNKALLDNSARPSGALVYTSGQHMTEAQFSRLKSELETNYQGAVNAGRPMLLEGGLDWKTMSMSPKDMDFIEAKNAAAREIALALGVPPMLLGIPGDNTYSNYQEANRVFWRQTVLPLVSRTLQAITAWLAPAFGPVELRPALDQIDALSGERAALWEMLARADFLTVGEKRAAAGFKADAE
jgi:HK97 family phage portal protein